ncbi:hypothetical protein NFJ02_43g110520 [Pycnococcus provasolii]
MLFCVVLAMSYIKCRGHGRERMVVWGSLSGFRGLTYTPTLMPDRLALVQHQQLIELQPNGNISAQDIFGNTSGRAISAIELACFHTRVITWCGGRSA